MGSGATLGARRFSHRIADFLISPSQLAFRVPASSKKREPGETGWMLERKTGGPREACSQTDVDEEVERNT